MSAPARNRPRLFRRFADLWPQSLGAQHYVFAAVFFLRLVVLIRLASSPLLLPNGSDMQFYDDWAKQILNGHWSDHRAFYGLPLYPFCVAALYRIFGYSPFVPGLFQAAFDAGTAALIYKITARVLIRSSSPLPRAVRLTAAFAAGSWCLFLPAQAYSVVLMPTAAATFAFWLLVWQIVRTENAFSRLGCLAAGLFVGFVAMGVATILFLAPLLLAAIILRGTTFAARFYAAGLLLVGIAGGTAPCWLHNYLIARDPVFLSAHGGINLWLGNNPEATGYPRFPGLHAGQGQMLRDSIQQAETALGRVLRRSEVSRYWSAKARSYIIDNPRAWSVLLTRKIANFWNAFEYDDLGVIRSLRAQAIILPGIHFGMVAIFGLAGAIMSWRSLPQARWIVAAIGLQLAAVLPVFVTERYRLPVVPGLLVLGAVGLQRLWQDLANGRYRMAGLQVGSIALIALFVTPPRHDPSLWALEEYNSGRIALGINDLIGADKHFQRAYALVPDNPETNFALGNLRAGQGRRSEAIRFYHAALRLDPKHKGALNNLGVIALDDQRPAEARDYLRKAIELEPQNVKTYFLLAKAELALGNVEGARIALARALEREPDQPEFRQFREEIERRVQP